MGNTKKGENKASEKRSEAETRDDEILQKLPKTFQIFYELLKKAREEMKGEDTI